MKLLSRTFSVSLLFSRFSPMPNPTVKQHKLPREKSSAVLFAGKEGQIATFRMIEIKIDQFYA